MPGFTSPDNIEYPVAGDSVAPLNAVFQNLAESTQDAITSDRALGYRYGGQVRYTASGTFTKASYPGLRAIRVRCVGGGGAGAGAPATTANNSCGAGGGGGGYAESFITNIAGIAASVTVTVGVGGASATGGAGSNGGDSSFGSLVIGNGGTAGGTSGPTSGTSGALGGAGGSGTGDLVIPGESGGARLTELSGPTQMGAGGASAMGAGAPPSWVFRSTDFTANGRSAGNYGGGGSGGGNRGTQSATGGGPGGNGIVIVELYY